MATIKNPVRFSAHFGVPESLLASLGVLNPTLNADTKLFIDPFLLSHSSHKELSVDGRAQYRKHFETVIKLLGASTTPDDVPWRNAQRMMQFPEIKGTCLGYGSQSVSGSGSGAFTTATVMQTAKAIVDLGVNDPDLFVALGLFEKGIGPDRISDMTTNVIFEAILKFNARVLPSIPVPKKRIGIALKNGNTYSAELPINPFEKGNVPVILVPLDVLRDLPIVNDWSDVSDAASKNAALRNQVNREIAEIWRRKTLKEKGKLKRWAMSDSIEFGKLLNLLKSANQTSYDIQGDPLGEVSWRRVAEVIAAEEPFTLTAPATNNVEEVSKTIQDIMEQFRFLIEDRRLSEELYHEGNVRPEKSAQRLFFAVAHAYCKANNLDLTPEADTGNGPVDFKMSSGYDGRVLVEIKLSTNPHVVKGYTRQLQKYIDAEETTFGFYVVLDVGKMGNKKKQLLLAKKNREQSGKPASEIVIIDGKRRVSASRLI